MPAAYDAVLILSFGGPEEADDVLPFLENVLRGRNVPRERMLEVAEHYYHFGGKSPINDQNRELKAALETELATHGHKLPVYWGNRNWHPFIADTLGEMRDAGVKSAVAFVTSAFSSYSGCRQYREDIQRAASAVEGAPRIDKLRGFFNHPGFIETMSDRVSAALEAVPAERRETCALIFTAHSIPMSMASNSRYVDQLKEASALVASAVDREDWQLAYQSRSGPPSQPWLEPDIGDALRTLAANGATDAVVVPIGFVSDHMEVLYDLDTEAAALAQELKMNLVRARTAGAHPRFVRMIRELIEERLEGAPPATCGTLAALPDFCPADCCPAPVRPAARA